MSSLCEKCKHTEAIQKRNLKRLPRIMVLHLKRFTYTLDAEANPIVNKLFDYVKINKKLYIGESNNTVVNLLFVTLIHLETSHVEGIPEPDFDSIIQELAEKRAAAEQEAKASVASGSSSDPLAVTADGVEEKSTHDDNLKRKQETLENSNETPEKPTKRLKEKVDGALPEKDVKVNKERENPQNNTHNENENEKEQRKETEKEKEKGKDKEKEKDPDIEYTFTKGNTLLRDIEDPPDLLTQMQRNPFQMPRYPISSPMSDLGSNISSIASVSMNDDYNLMKALEASRESYDLEQALKASAMEYSGGSADVDVGGGDASTAKAMSTPLEAVKEISSLCTMPQSLPLPLSRNPRWITLTLLLYINCVAYYLIRVSPPSRDITLRTCLTVLLSPHPTGLATMTRK